MSTTAVKKKVSAEVEHEMSVYPELLRLLLRNRGIVTVADAEIFLSPNYAEQVHDPFLMRDMDKAVARILHALDKKEKILIYSDYDADGIPGAVVLHDFFKKIGYDLFENYIPHRHDEGYGFHIEALDGFKAKGISLIVTVDCGINDVKEVSRAHELGIDVIVTDHHEPGETLPIACAVLDPKRKDCTYPFDMLCGAGVAYKLVQGLIQKKDFGLKSGVEKWFLDMVGIATISDMVPLTGENRIFAYYGLKVLRKSPRPGIIRLLRKLKTVQAHLTEDDIAFTISPRINAASRMGTSEEAFRLLSTVDEIEAGILVDHLNKVNDERKGYVAAMVKDIRKHLASRSDFSSMPIIVAGNPEWRPSLLGLAANSLAEDYGCPVFLWGRDGGSMIKGSCRSDGKANLVEIMEATRETFLEFGGHKLAGGFSVSHEKVHELETKLIAAYESLGLSQKKKVDPTTLVDVELKLSDVNHRTYSLIEKLSPYGIGNPKPLFLFKSIKIDDARMFGKQSNHVEISFTSGEGRNIKAIGFFMKKDQFGETLKNGQTIDLFAHIEKSIFRGYAELRLRIVDVVFR